jgi:hypothetical protein
MPADYFWFLDCSTAVTAAGRVVLPVAFNSTLFKLSR